MSGCFGETYADAGNIWVGLEWGPFGAVHFGHSVNLSGMGL